MEEIPITTDMVKLLLEDKDPKFRVLGETHSVYEGGAQRAREIFLLRDSNPPELYTLVLEQENEKEECGRLLVPVEIETVTVTVREVSRRRLRVLRMHGLL